MPHFLRRASPPRRGVRSPAAPCWPRGADPEPRGPRPRRVGLKKREAREPAQERRPERGREGLVVQGLGAGRGLNLPPASARRGFNTWRFLPLLSSGPLLREKQWQIDSELDKELITL